MPSCAVIYRREQVMKNPSSHRAFTLVELLLVIVLLALLLALLIPSAAKSKEMARRIVCASNQRQITIGLTLYAQDHDGYLANFTMVHGPNVHDIDKRFVEMMNEKYHVQEDFFFCPSTTKDNIRYRMNYNKSSSDTYILGYYFWVPRLSAHYSSQIPPSCSKNGLIVVDSTKYWGPQKTTDPLCQTNPVVTDEVITVAGSPPDANICKEYSLINSSSCHLWNKRLEMINQAFIDGRVDHKKAVELKARYGYNNGTNGWLYR